MNEDGTPKTGETAEVLGQVKNEALDATKLANELAEAKKIAQQAQMRAQQLENAEAARKKADEEARQKQLEENEEYKTLYEREKAQREELIQEREQEAQSEALKKAKQEVLNGFSSEVLEIAEATGLSLYDDSEESKAELKAKLEVISSKVGNTTKKVMGNNTKDETTDGNEDYIKMRFSDVSIAREARKNAISKLPALEEMRKISGMVK